MEEEGEREGEEGEIMIKAKFSLTSCEMDQLIDSCVNKFYGNIRRECPEMYPYIDVSDLRGEAYLAVCSSISKRKKEVPLNYFLVTTIGNHLKNYIDKEIRVRAGLDNSDFDVVLRDKVVEEDIDMRDMRASVDVCLLDSREQDIFKGLLEGQTYQVIGIGHGISPQRVAEIKKNITKKLRKE